MSATKIVILGAGGPGRDLLEIIKEINYLNEDSVYECVGFLDNDPDKVGLIINGIEVLGPVSVASDLDEGVRFVNTIGGDSYHWKLPDIIGEADVDDSRFETVIHPDSYVAESANLGHGVVVYPGSIIHSNANIGHHVMVKDARISHDQNIGDYTRIEAGVSMVGSADVGECCYLGMNCTLRESIEQNVIVGMGSVVIEEVKAGKVVAGNPAKYIRDVEDSQDRYEEL